MTYDGYDDEFMQLMTLHDYMFHHPAVEEISLIIVIFYVTSFLQAFILPIKGAKNQSRSQNL